MMCGERIGLRARADSASQGVVDQFADPKAKAASADLAKLSGRPEADRLAVGLDDPQPECPLARGPPVPDLLEEGVVPEDKQQDEGDVESCGQASGQAEEARQQRAARDRCFFRDAHRNCPLR